MSNNDRLTRSALQNNPTLKNNLVIPEAFSRSKKIVRSPPKPSNYTETFVTLNINKENSNKNTGTKPKELNKNHLTINIKSNQVPENIQEPDHLRLLNSPTKFYSPSTPYINVPTKQDNAFYETLDNSFKQNVSLIDIEGITEQPSLVGNNNYQSNAAFTFDNLTNINMTENQQPLRLSLKYVANLVPEFDGKNISIDEYIEKLKHAKSMLSIADQANLIPILKVKIKGEVYRAMRNATINNIDEFIKAVREMFPSTDNLYSLYGKVTDILQKNDETTLSFANRLQEMVLKIKELKNLEEPTEAERISFTNSINQHALESFKRGLKQEIRLELGAVNDLSSAIKKAIRIETQLKKAKQDILSNNTTDIFCSIKNQHTTCQICQGYDHEALFCNNASCVYCKNKDHLSNNCRRTKNKIELICKFCNNQGHSIDACKLNKVKGSHCQYCQLMGHTVTQCPFIIEYELCWKCKESGHDPNACTKQSNTAESCEFCNSSNHTIKNCPLVMCKRCNKQGHTLKYCPIDKNYGRFVMCAICNSDSHDAIECEEAKILVAQNRTRVYEQGIKCQICDGNGHSGKSCPQLKNLHQNTNNAYGKYNSQNFNNPNNSRKFSNFYNQNRNINGMNTKHVVCDYCKIRGHSVETCRKLRNLESISQNQETCVYCKESGHSIENCNQIRALEAKVKKFCNICKNTNHMTEECFKLQNQQNKVLGNE